MSTAHIASARSAGNSNTSVHQRNNAGTGGWDADHGATVYGIAVDSNGNVAVGGASNGTYTTRKYNSAGTLQWSANHGNQVNAVAVDSSGNVYTAGALASSVAVRQYDSAGTLNSGWNWDVNSKTMNAIHFGADGYIYVAGTYDSASVTNCAMRDTAGNTQWYGNLHTGQTLYGIAADASGNIYVAGVRSGTLLTTRKYDSSRTLQWSKDHGDTVYCICVDGAGNVYTGGASSIASGGVSTRKYNSSGTQQWAVDHGATVRGIAVDADGNVYTTGASNGTYTTRKYDSSGSAVWSITVSADSYAIALGTDPPNIVPGLPIKLALGVPFATVYHDIQALPIKLALGVPTASDPPLPPLGDGQTIYRLYLATGTNILELPLKSFQCRRRRNDSTWLAVESPAPSAATLAALLKTTREIVIYSGIRDSAGTETMGEFLRATVTEWETEKTSASYGLNLTCRVAAVNETLQTRALEGVIETKSDAGRRSIRAEKVNHRLRPGDTVTYGAISFVAHNVTYEVGVGGAWMEVQEAPVG